MVSGRLFLPGYVTRYPGYVAARRDKACKLLATSMGLWPRVETEGHDKSTTLYEILVVSYIFLAFWGVRLIRYCLFTAGTL